METLYDLLGALPKDDADELRAAFRRAVKRVHPDKNREDPDAGAKFRRIVRANEILGDVKQRAAYDHLLALARHDQEQAARHAAAYKVHRVATGVMVLAGISIVAVGGYALFVQLSANALMPATATAEAGREPAAIVATGVAEEGPASISAAPQETSGHTDVVAFSAARTASGRERPPPGNTPKSATIYTGRSILLDRLRTFTHAFAALAAVEHPHRTRRRSSSPQGLARQRDR